MADALLEVSLCRLLVRNRYQFLPHHIPRRDRMAGEIRQKMEALRAARAHMVKTMAAEIDKVTAEVATTHQDGLAALALPRAELDQYKQEIAEIRDEFKSLTNGGPPGPLPGSPDAGAPAAPPGVSTGRRDL